MSSELYRELKMALEKVLTESRSNHAMGISVVRPRRQDVWPHDVVRVRLSTPGVAVYRVCHVEALRGQPYAALALMRDMVVEIEQTLAAPNLYRDLVLPPPLIPSDMPGARCSSRLVKEEDQIPRPSKAEVDNFLDHLEQSL